MSKTMTLRPRISEKAYGLSQSTNVYVFHVPAEANRLTVSRAVAEQFKVTVTNIKMLNQKGKTKRSVRKTGRSVTGHRVNRKFAYVTLKQGDSLPIFAAEEADDAKKSKDPTKVQTKRGKK
ncbi:MAG TPA: 50S ribosomal protein L23 [Candidatus Saccharimonadales bacterium]|nr:50S ribosomal protein L23 [Candidatus Saccharimonadales bacterium]